MRLAGFFAALAAATIGAGTVAAQTSPQVYQVGVLSVGADPTDQSPLGAGLIRGFARQGFVLGKNLALERRAAHGQLDRLPQLVDELVASKVAVIVTGGYPAALAAKQHSTLPVVVVQAGDPLKMASSPALLVPAATSPGCPRSPPSCPPSAWRC
jgi:putative tryptophan/tyrosine transport system substrate-binding protein